jgi:NAD(P)-dependent dehydrogenase (short-subunit alcohol dehydrogenase family)
MVVVRLRASPDTHPSSTIVSIMNNKIVLVTGSTDGIGKETALQLAKLSATVIVHGRSVERCQAVCDDIRQATGNSNVDFVAADLSSQHQVRHMAAEIQERYDRLHVLINNAGVIVLKRQLTEDGVEMTLAINHLAPFLLTNLLLERLKTSAPARIVNVSSTVHYDAPLKLDDLQSEKNYNGINAYKLSKLGNVLFTFELAERLKGSGVTANCLHPGVVATKLLNTGWGWSNGLSPAQGAALSVYLASSPEVENVTGKYFERTTPDRSSSKADDVQLRRKFWDVSAQLAGLTESVGGQGPFPLLP